MNVIYKPINDYTAMPWHYQLVWSDDQKEPWTVRIQELPGLMTHGQTPQEAINNVPEAIESYILSLQAAGEPVPPVSDEPYIEDSRLEPFDYEKWLAENDGVEEPETHEYRIARDFIGHHMLILWDEAEEGWTHQWSPPTETETIEQLRAEWDKASQAFHKDIIPYERLSQCNDRACSCWYDNRTAEVGRKYERKRIVEMLDALLADKPDLENLSHQLARLKAELLRLS